MTADFEILPDLEDFDNLCKGFIEGYINDCNLPFSPVKKPPLSFEPYNMFGGAFYDAKLPSLDCHMEFESAPLFEESLGFMGHDFNNAFIHSEKEPEYLDLVDPISCLPMDHAVPCLPRTQLVSCLPITPDDKEEDEDDYDDEKYDFDESLESVLPDDIMDLTDEKLIKLVDNNFMNCSNYVSLDDVLVKKPRKFTHLDIDHSYSIRPEGYYEEVNEYFSTPLSPSSSEGSETAPKGSKRGRPPKKNTACKKIKQEICSEDDEEVDVESPFTVSFVVPKITLELSPPPSPPTPPKRGRKPKNKSPVQKNKKPAIKNKNCPVPPKVLEEAIKKQQTKKNYVTKSGRITNISHSVESSPSTSTQSSQNSSRCSSDNEDTADKRASHNQAERQRRQQLTDLFQILRKRVPNIMSNPKASKVAILTEASKYIEDLEEIQRTRKLCRDQEKTELAKKLSLLQSLLR